MGKGSSPNHTTSTVTQTSLPEYAEPYVMDAMQWAQGVSQRPYEAYNGPRISPFSGDQMSAFDLTRNLPNTGMQNYADANALTNQATGIQQNSGYTAQSYNPSAFSNQNVASANWNTGAAQQYMDPFITQVMDTTLARNQSQFDRDQTNRDSRRAMAGSFGGLRHGVEDAVAQRQFGLDTSMQEAGLLSQAYNTAFQNFSGDQARGLQAQIANQGADIQRQTLQEGANQFGANFNNQGLLNQAQIGQQQAAGLAALGQQTAGLGDQQRDAMMQSIDALRATGLDQQRQTQASLDLGYQDFVNQRDYEMQMLNFYNSILRGMPISSNSNVVNQEAQNPYSQMLGIGLGATGLINALGSGGGGTTTGGGG